MLKRARRLVQGEWRLRAYLQFPWRPLIDILGTTTYTLDASTSKVCCLPLMAGRRGPSLDATQGQHCDSPSQRSNWPVMQRLVTLPPQVVKHVEGWNVSGTEAISQMFRASARSRWRVPGR